MRHSMHGSAVQWRGSDSNSGACESDEPDRSSLHPEVFLELYDWMWDSSTSPIFEHVT
jgi:hypothetical protein